MTTEQTVAPAPGFTPPSLPSEVTVTPAPVNPSSFRRLTPEELAAEKGVPRPASAVPPAAPQPEVAPQGLPAPVLPPPVAPQPPPQEDPIAAAVRKQEEEKALKARYDEAVAQQAAQIFEGLKADDPEGNPKQMAALAKQMAVTRIQASIAAVQAAQQQLPAVIDPAIQQAQANQQAHARFAAAYPTFAAPELRKTIDDVAVSVMQAAHAAGRPIQDEASLFQATAAMLGVLFGQGQVPARPAQTPPQPAPAGYPGHYSPQMAPPAPVQPPPPGYTWVLAPAPQQGAPTGMPPHHVAHGLPASGGAPVTAPLDDLAAFMALQRQFST